VRRSVEQSRRLATALGCLAIPALLLAGCGSAPATSQGMAASAYDVEQQHQRSTSEPAAPGVMTISTAGSTASLRLRGKRTASRGRDCVRRKAGYHILAV